MTTASGRSVDVQITAHGSIFLFHPQSQAGREWLAAHAPDDAQWFGLALVVEHRYANNWAVEALDAGMAVA